MAGTRLTHWICGIGLAVLAAGCSRTGDTPDSVPVEKSGLESTITSGSTTTSATTPAADVLPEADPPAIPLPHQAILDAMQKTRAVHFKDATLDECLQDLSKSLGVEIVLHEDLRKSLNDRRAGLGPTTSV
ncbi:MAG: hypothetical protein H8E37_10380, partial [Planctomycetes bacterium]|nr:hypothetical protein [Planctomycetota bacterium]